MFRVHNFGCRPAAATVAAALAAVAVAAATAAAEDTLQQEALRRGQPCRGSAVVAQAFLVQGCFGFVFLSPGQVKVEHCAPDSSLVIMQDGEKHNEAG